MFSPGKIEDRDDLFSWREGDNLDSVIGISTYKKKEGKIPRTDDFLDGHLLVKGVNQNRNNLSC